MEKTLDYEKFRLIFELTELAERAFVHKLRAKNPKITEAEIAAAVRDWYHDRPGAPLGDSNGVPGDIRRFKTCDHSEK